MRARSISGPGIVLAGLVGLTPAGGAGQTPDHLWIPGADPERGRGLVMRYDCGVCHTIQSVRGARGIVGPKLERFAERTVLAGSMANVPRNLVAWLMDPPAIDPATAMPDLGLSEAEARDIAAFLYTLGASAAAEAYRPVAELPAVGLEDGGASSPGAGEGATDIPIERAMEILSSHPPETPDPAAAAD